MERMRLVGRCGHEDVDRTVASEPSIPNSKAVNDRVASGSFIKRALFSLAYKRKLAAVERGHGAPLWDRLVFKKAIVPILGGRVRLVCFIMGILAPSSLSHSLSTDVSNPIVPARCSLAERRWTARPSAS